MQRGEGAKIKVVKPRNSTTIKIIAGCILFVVLSVYCGGLAVLIHLPSLINSAGPPKEFCTLDDPIVQAIEAHADEWLTILATVEGYPKIHWVEINGRSFGVRRTGNDDTPIFYITTKIRWPGTAEYGNNGYFYSPERHPSFVFGIRLKAERLTDSVYCYSWNYDV